MFGLDPFSRPVAIFEMLLLLAFAAFVGWMLARLILAGRISALRSDIDDRENSLKTCRDSKLALTEAPVRVARKTPAPVVVIPAEPGQTEAVMMSRIAARANEVNFDRIGRAVATEADDLKDIVGVGPFLERKLYSLGIYTFRQVGSFTKEDIEKVNDIIEFFPGRIERDDWVGQARLFHEQKYGTKI